jgi:hypothetical protein
MYQPLINRFFDLRVEFYAARVVVDAVVTKSPLWICSLGYPVLL